MASIEVRAYIKILVKKSKSNKEIHEELAKMYPTTLPSKTTINTWIQKFKFGRDELEDQTERKGVLEIDYDRYLAPISHLIKSGKKISIREIAAKFKLSIGVTHHIVKDLLGLKKLTPTKVPYDINIDQKKARLSCSEAMLKLYNRCHRDFLENLFTMDETWLSVFDPESRTESMEWVHDRSELSKVSTADRRDPKVMACVYWYGGGILKIFWCQQGSTVTGDIYRQQLREIDELIKTKLPKTPLFLQDNARPHKAHATMDLIKELGWKTIFHPPYSPDLAPSDFYLFRNLKKYLRGRRFGTIAELKSEVEDFFIGKPPSWYLDGLKELPTRYQKCIASSGEYFD